MDDVILHQNSFRTTLFFWMGMMFVLVITTVSDLKSRGKFRMISSKLVMEFQFLDFFFGKRKQCRCR